MNNFILSEPIIRFLLFPEIYPKHHPNYRENKPTVQVEYQTRKHCGYKAGLILQ